MSQPIIARYLNPWRFKREQQELQRVAELRKRDGDDCRRCRRPMRFNLTTGHDLGPRVESIPTGEQCLTHVRCNAQGTDNTAEVTARVRRKNEAELFASSRRPA
jgi:hypothetical protein